MRDLSLHILDLVQNSITAGATLIRIELIQDAQGWLTVSVEDDGCGMPESLVNEVRKSPFATTRTTRPVGLGISLFASNSQLTGGELTLRSTEGRGTYIAATFNLRQIDCLPVGDIAGTMVSLVLGHPETPAFLLRVQSPKGEMTFDTREVREVLQGVPLDTPDVLAWIKDAIEEEVKPILGGLGI